MRLLPPLLLVGLCLAVANVGLQEAAAAEHALAAAAPSLRVAAAGELFHTLFVQAAAAAVVCMIVAALVALAASMRGRRASTGLAGSTGTAGDAAAGADIAIGTALLAGSFAWRWWWQGSAWRAAGAGDVAAALAAVGRASLSLAGVAAGTGLLVTAVALAARSRSTLRAALPVAVACAALAGAYSVDHVVHKRLAAITEFFMWAPWSTREGFQPARTLGGEPTSTLANAVPPALTPAGFELGEGAAGFVVGETDPATTLVVPCDAAAIDARLSAPGAALGRALVDARAGPAVLRCLADTILRRGKDADKRRAFALIGAAENGETRVDAGDVALSNALSTGAARAVGVLPCEVAHDELREVLSQVAGKKPRAPFDPKAADAVFHARPGVTAWSVRPAGDDGVVHVDVPTAAKALLPMPAGAGARGCFVIDDDTTGDALLSAVAQVDAAGVDVRIR